MFQSITTLVTRLIDPNEFQSLQDLMFAGFASVDGILLAPAAIGIGAIGVTLLRFAPMLDVLALGHDVARSLGVPVDRLLRRGFLAVAAPVSIATALVGPILFLGLVAAHLAYRTTRTHRHAVTVPVAAGFGAKTLVTGQFVLERLLDSGTRLSMIVGFVGGLLVLRLLFAEASR